MILVSINLQKERGWIVRGRVDGAGLYYLGTIVGLEWDTLVD